MLGKLTEQQVEIHDVTFLQQIFQSDIIILLQQVYIAVPGTSPLPRHVRQSVACTRADTNRIRKADAPVHEIVQHAAGEYASHASTLQNQAAPIVYMYYFLHKCQN